MGLSFLNKKQVHPGTFGNIEDVWKAERDHEERIRKHFEKEKKLKEERQIEEIKMLKVQAGLIPKSENEKLDFIYKEDPGFNRINNLNLTEEFFDKKNETKKPKISQTFSYSENISNPKNEIFTKTHEDPLFLIKKEELRRRKEIEENPYKMKKLLKEIEEELLNEESKFNKKKDKAHKNKHNKEDKKQYKDYEASSVSTKEYHNNNFKTSELYSHRNNNKRYEDKETVSCIKKKTDISINQDSIQSDSNIYSSIHDYKQSDKYGLFGGKSSTHNNDGKSFTPDLSKYNKKQEIIDMLNKYKVKK